MIRLHPLPDPFHQCPYCQVVLEVKGWYIPGMRNLANLECNKCGRKYYGDLLAGHGLFFPLLLEQESGKVHDQYDVGWFSRRLGDTYANRQSAPLRMTTEIFRPIKRPLLLNCLDVYYGHCMQKMFNAQYYIDNTPEYDLILLVPRFQRWMVPDGAAAIWTVDRNLREGAEWNDWLAGEIHRKLDDFEKAWLSVAFPHPHPEEYDIARYTKVAPFPVNEWGVRMDRPIVTFVWREDRLWNTKNPPNQLRARINYYLNRLGMRSHDPLRPQTRKVVALAKQLSQRVENLQFFVSGVGKPGGLPKWIHDLRSDQIDTDQEKKWCQLYARSHVVVGVHGANMLLPSGHAGAVVDLTPLDRWGNLLQDLVWNSQKVPLVNLLIKTLPISISIRELAKIISDLLVQIGEIQLEMSREFTYHNNPEITNIPKKLRLEMAKAKITGKSVKQGGQVKG